MENRVPASPAPNSSDHHSVSTAKGDKLGAVKPRCSHSPIQTPADKLIALIITLSQGLIHGLLKLNGHAVVGVEESEGCVHGGDAVDAQSMPALASAAQD